MLLSLVARRKAPPILDPDPKDHSIDEVIRATRDDELFLFVNDAVLGVPGPGGRFLF
jgi:hypothetical protein